MASWLDKLLGKKEQHPILRDILDSRQNTRVMPEATIECRVASDIRKGGILITARGNIYELGDSPYSKAFLEVGNKTISLVDRSETVMSLDTSFWNDNEKRITSEIERKYGTRIKQIEDWKKSVDKNKFLTLVKEIQDQLKMPRQRIAEKLRMTSHACTIQPLLYILSVCSNISDSVRQRFAEQIEAREQYDEPTVEQIVKDPWGDAMNELPSIPVQELDPRKNRILEKIQRFEQTHHIRGLGRERYVEPLHIPSGPVYPESELARDAENIEWSKKLGGGPTPQIRERYIPTDVRQRITNKIFEFKDTESTIQLTPIKDTDDIIAAGPMFKKNLVTEIFGKPCHILILNGGSLTRVWKLVPDESEERVKIRLDGDAYALRGVGYADWLADMYNEQLQLHLKSHFDMVYSALSRKKDEYINAHEHLEAIIKGEIRPGNNDYMQFGYKNLGGEKGHQIYKYVRPVIQNILGRLYPFPQRPANRASINKNLKVIEDGPGPVPVCTTLTYDYDVKKIKKSLPYIERALTDVQYPMEFRRNIIPRELCVPKLKLEWGKNPYLSETDPASDVRYFIMEAIGALSGWDLMKRQRLVLSLDHFEDVTEERAQKLHDEGKYYWEKDVIYRPPEELIHGY